MLKVCFITAVLTFSLFCIAGINLTEIDSQLDNYQYLIALNTLENSFDKSNPDPALIWRIGRCYYEISQDATSKRLLALKCSQGMEFLKNYFDLKSGLPSDRAAILYWYAALNLRYIKSLGAKKSLDYIPDILRLCDAAIALDRQYPYPYFLKGEIDRELPAMLGGNKFRMALNFNKALEIAPENIEILVYAGISLKERNWKSSRKIKLFKKLNQNDGFGESNDRQIAKILLTRAIETYAKQENKTKFHDSLIVLAVKELKGLK